ncbi:MAG: protein kinase [Planctomycetia bacterium]|nr:protein kinase [Planctomycetia bacterium]
MSDIHTGTLEPRVTLAERVSLTQLSEVWRGKRLPSGEDVAVKFAASPGSAAALLPEAETVAALLASGVPGVVPAEYSDRPIPHLVLPWKGPRTFRAVLDAARTGDERAAAVGILVEVVKTVAAVHHEGFMHGDLKPENILVDETGRPWLIDFGMARAIHAARLDSRVSQSMDGGDAGWGGTLHYMPPEGLQGDAPAASWDVYALGVMLHEALLGTRPDRAATPDALRALLPAAVADLLLDALAYAPADRSPTAGALLYHLDSVASDLTRTGLSRLFYRARRLAVAGLAAFFVALRYASVAALLSLYVFFLFAMRKEPVAFLAFVPFAIFHVVVRWEGPETPEEAQIRKQGGVVWR